MGKKWYAVQTGRKTGLFDTWEDCKAQVSGFSGAVYKSFVTKREAEAYLSAAKEKKALTFPIKQEAAAYVDGSYDSASHAFSYGMVILRDGREQCFSEKMTDALLAPMRNVAGEIKGAEAAMRYAAENGLEKITIYHDYEGIAKWCTGAWKANKEGTKAYRAYYLSICDRVLVEFVKVKGHSGDRYNDMADALAKQALR